MIFFHPDSLLSNEERYKSKSQSFRLEQFKDTKYYAQIPKSLNKPRHFPCATISLIKEHSFNYYHFLYECLPKLLLIQSQLKNHFNELYSTIPVVILIDQNTPEQCLYYIRSVVNFTFKIERLASNEIAYCETLFYCSPFFNTLDNISDKNFNISDFYVDRYAIGLIKELSNSMVERHSKPPSRLLYLDRKTNQLRKIINSAEVKQLLNYNFEFIFPDQYSISEQITLFQSAKFVIGASGAAFSNIIHMQENTSAVIFSPSLSFTNYHIFEQQAEAAGVNLIHLQTSNTNKIQTLHDDVYIDIELLKSLLCVLGL